MNINENQELKTHNKLLYLIAEASYLCSHRLNLVLEASRAGFQVAVATRCNDKIRDYQQEIEAAGIKVFPLKYFNRAGVNPWRQLLAIRELNKIYQEYRPDIVHHVALKPIILGSILALINRVPKIINALGGLGYLFTEPLGGFKKSTLRYFTCHILRVLFSKKNTLLILQNPDDLKTLSHAKVLAANSVNQVIIIRGAGVDLNAFKETSPPPANPLVISCVSRMLWDKGIGELVDAALILREYFKNKNSAKNLSNQSQHAIAINLYGMPDPENPASISYKQLETWHKNGIITWKRHCDNVAKAYTESHIAVLPSYREGLPKSLLEAASCGRPIVTTDVPGCREVVKTGQNGFLIPAKDAEALAKVLIKLIEDEPLRIQMGKQSRKMVEEQFSDVVINQQIIELYGSELHQDSSLCKTSSFSDKTDC